MTMSGRGVRVIVVDGRGYRWKLNAQSPQAMALVVEPEGGRALLEVQLPDEWYYGSVTPRQVEELVRAAVGEGWDPDEAERRLHWRWDGRELQRVR